MTIKVLISPINVDEVNITLKGRPDIIDIKNPLEGTLGANFPRVIKAARKLIDVYNQKSRNSNIKLSVAIGDFPNLPGSASLAALGATVCGADFVKIGLMGVTTFDEAIKLAKEVVEAVKGQSPNVKVVIAGYSDQAQLNTSINCLQIPNIAKLAGADIAMLDSAIKNGKSTFEHLTIKQLQQFIKITHDNGLESAIAGSLKFSDLENLKLIQPDIIGVRSMVCENFDRVKGTIRLEHVQKLMAEIK